MDSKGNTFCHFKIIKNIMECGLTSFERFFRERGGFAHQGPNYYACAVDQPPSLLIGLTSVVW